jgi:hypothetical protein
LVTLETPPVHPIVARRASPVVNATLAAILGLSVPANALNVEVSAAQLLVRADADGKSARTPFGGGEAVVGGTVVDPQGAVIPNAVVELISDAGAELETKTSGEGEFRFAQVPYGAYIMLVEAQRFYTHVNSNVIVDTPYDTHFEVTMRINRRSVIMGAMAILRPQSLLDLYQESDLVAIASVGRSALVETDGKTSRAIGVLGMKSLRTSLHVSSQLKGENSQQLIPLYYWVSDTSPAQFKQGDKLMVLLKHRKSEDGRQLDGYEATGWGDSIKKLDNGSLAIYRQRIEELTAIFQSGNPDPAKLVEWLVRCVEEPATREEGVRTLSESLSALASQRERENWSQSQSDEIIEESTDQQEDDEVDSSEQPPDDNIAKWEQNSLKLAAALTQEHRTRLANALFGIAELSEDDMKLVSLIQKLGDDRLEPYLVSQLRRVADRAPRFAESLVWSIAGVINDDDLKRLASDYDDAAEYDKSEHEDESSQQASTRNQRADGLTVAAIKRSATLKDFLKLVEYKTGR